MPLLNWANADLQGASVGVNSFASLGQAFRLLLPLNMAICTISSTSCVALLSFNCRRRPVALLSFNVKYPLQV